MSKTKTGALLACIASSAWHPGVTAQALEDLSPAVRDFVALEASHVHIRGVDLIDGTSSTGRRSAPLSKPPTRGASR